MPVPISKYNFDVYGASTTPTLVLLDRTGKVAMYHPGALPYDQLKAEIEKWWRDSNFRRFELLRRSGLHIVNKPPHRNMFRNPRMGLHPVDLLPDVLLQIVESMEMGRRSCDVPILSASFFLSSSSLTFSSPQSVWLMMMNSCVSSR